MSFSALVHPSPEVLKAFALGRLPPDEEEHLAKHVAECAICCETLRAAPDDTFVERIKGVQSPEASTLPAPPATAKGQAHEVPEALANHLRYRVIGVLGQGGMGLVYKAEHRLMERLVALKMINKKMIDEPMAVARFVREVKAAASLFHPNIVTAYDAEQAGELMFLVTELVDGVSLDKYVDRQGPLPLHQAASFIRQAALGLQHAHEKGMIHRDIKPQNLMLTRTAQVKILDFGLARFAREAAPSIVPAGASSAVESNSRLTRLDVVLGTPDYIAPEQANDSRSADIRADIYSLGCTFYYLLTGRPPFAGGSILAKLSAHTEKMPDPPSQFRGDVPPEVDRILMKMVAKNPADRYAKPAEVAQALAGYAKTPSTNTIAKTKAATTPLVAPVANPQARAPLAVVSMPAPGSPAAGNTPSPGGLTPTAVAPAQPIRGPQPVAPLAAGALPLGGVLPLAAAGPSPFPTANTPATALPVTMASPVGNTLPFAQGATLPGAGPASAYPQAAYSPVAYPQGSASLPLVTPLTRRDEAPISTVPRWAWLAAPAALALGLVAVAGTMLFSSPEAKPRGGGPVSERSTPGDDSLAQVDATDSVRSFWPSEKPSPSGDDSPSPSPSQPPLVPSTGPASRAKVVIVIPKQGLYYPDYGPLREVLERRGIAVQVASTALGDATTMPAGAPQVPVDLELADVDARQIDALVFVGYNVADFVTGGSHVEATRQLLRAMKSQGKLLCSICAGNAVLANSGLLYGRRVPASQYAKEQGAKPTEAIWVQERLIIDDRIITARGAEEAREFGNAIATKLSK